MGVCSKLGEMYCTSHTKVVLAMTNEFTFYIGTLTVIIVIEQLSVKGQRLLRAAKIGLNLAIHAWISLPL